MIYRKRAYTPPPCRAVRGTEYIIEMHAPDGGVLRITYRVKDSDLIAYDPRLALAEQLRRMRRTLRERMAAYMLGFRSC